MSARPSGELLVLLFFFFQAEDGIRDLTVTGVQTCALPIWPFHAVVAITRGGLVPAAIVARELGLRIIDTVCVASYDHDKQGELKVLKGVSADVAKLGGGTGKGLLIVDDLVDTGKTGRLVRALLPDAHFAAGYAKPKGRPLVDTYITEVSQDTWIHFPWDTALSYQPPIRGGA